MNNELVAILSIELPHRNKGMDARMDASQSDVLQRKYCVLFILKWLYKINLKIATPTRPKVQEFTFPGILAKTSHQWRKRMRNYAFSINFTQSCGYLFSAGHPCDIEENF